MMKVLVLTADYPNPEGGLGLYYAHTRNLYYASRGVDVSVLSFAAREDYEIEGIPVYNVKSIRDKLRTEVFDILVCHAPNLRNHYLFMCLYGALFPAIVFVFHGHEVLRRSKVYPRPYSYTTKSTYCRLVLNDFYDIIKCRVWKRAFERIYSKSWFVFVSHWMQNQFVKWVGIDPSKVESHTRIIYNSIGQEFEKERYERDTHKLYDFVTIRSSLDGAKYCIDIVTNLARSNPQFRFCVVGRGDFYRFIARPDNVTHIDKHLNHDEIISLLNRSKCALMPTRTDAQGVMACEIATFGIPLLTSDIPVCREVFAEFDNVAFISNETPCVDFEQKYRRLICLNSPQKNTKYFAENTTGKEVELFREIVEEGQQ